MVHHSGISDSAIAFKMIRENKAVSHPSFKLTVTVCVGVRAHPDQYISKMR